MPPRWGQQEIDSITNKIRALRPCSPEGTAEQEGAAGGDPADQTGEEREEPNYSQWLEEYIAEFGIARSLTAFTTKVKETAKSINIKFKSKRSWQLWTPQQEDRLVQLVQRCQKLDIPWDEIGRDLNRSGNSVKRKYFEKISARQHIEHVVQSLDDSKIEAVMDGLKFVCTHCEQYHFSAPRVWGSDMYCRECHDNLFRGEMSERWREIQQYCVDNGKVSCAFCHKGAGFEIQGEDKMTYFHFDHENMFDKGDSVCNIVENGKPLTEAFTEIDKCQLLCISCHQIVTKIENSIGFTRFKRDMTMETDEERRAALREDISPVYTETMRRVYEYLRGARGGS
ncbi:hypothetical protein GUITHDRAFT_109241 [Guillardia theta CCMP2712]|uniref:Myb-like domain-containing protein n=1 Tax=Guillardia theta (strain CCMP2712) TaxID=905079 RepID=L1J9R1_GUITC|nr:hypothetical protein GUITHDRAFT_109241 [Guillardia theta CCMP2712]EKX44815.1 hypothetical protein GUITHDRAFT_109241 [Guillardia theta CCMP2712]|mmetsp:Transcript_27174/g.88817  ORF Transcript_27174/g.88817 Transcript_27174/m.88817 type:complete len:340 (-) Transcript_27174:146-1165(-)|eukprot:XP_005831795.1 hypothetical protein GUITHDRAFT_109241 [Guillardia theta CCMP2712]